MYAQIVYILIVRYPYAFLEKFGNICIIKTNNGGPIIRTRSGCMRKNNTQATDPTDAPTEQTTEEPTTEENE